MARQPVVRHNDWGSLAPPTLGGWEPTLSVTVVVPTFNYQRTLPYVLAGLAAQSYPSHLLEVIGPPVPAGSMPETIFDVVPKLREQLAAETDLARLSAERQAQEEREAEED